MENNTPVLVTKKPLKSEFEHLKQIALTCDNFTLGRGLNNSAVVAFISISRNHCIFKKIDNDWVIEDNSSLGITVNGNKLGKGKQKKLNYEDVIVLEPSEEFVYQFINQSEIFEIPRKRIKLEKPDSEDILNDVKLTFEQSQSYEIKHIEKKIQNAKSMQETSRILKEQLQLDMGRKIKQLENDFALQIENLNGEKNHVEEQKALLLAERDAQLASVKEEMEGKLTELKDQIQKHNETESKLLNENNNLKEKLLMEREEFLAELNRESTSKQEMLDKLKAKMKEQEEIRMKEKYALEQMLKNEIEQIRLAKEKELKELEELKQQREKELEQELMDIRKNLELTVQEAEQNRLKSEKLLNEQMEQRKKLTDEEKVKREQLMQEREEIQKKLTEAESSAEKSIEELKARVQERETELAALAADRIQKQAEQSSEVINSLQEQLEKVKNQLESVESEKRNLLESIVASEPADDSSTKQSTLAEVGELMENELQCSICAELFVAATTLNCSHTFCKYCITMWKKKKKDCPICRTSISSECKSLVLDSFIEKMVQNLTEEMKKKRQEMLKAREELESELARQQSVGTSRRSDSYVESDYNSDSEFFEEGEEEEELDEEHSPSYTYWPFRRRDHDDWSDTDSGSVYADDSDEYSGETASGADGGGPTGDAPPPAAPNDSTVSNSTERRAGGDGNVRRRGGVVAGVEGAYFGGYGRCFCCGARGHWAPGCPFR